MSSKDLKMRFDSQFCRINCQMFSWGLSSGARGGSGRSVMLFGALSVYSVRTGTAWPMANDPPFAILNHFAGDLGIPGESQPLSGFVLGVFRLLIDAKTPGVASAFRANSPEPMPSSSLSVAALLHP